VLKFGLLECHLLISDRSSLLQLSLGLAWVESGGVQIWLHLLLHHALQLARLDAGTHRVRLTNRFEFLRANMSRLSR